MKISKITLSAALTISLSQNSIAATASDIDKMTTYATILGRAVACGQDVEAPMRRVGKWMDRKFPPGTEDQQTYLPVFIEGIQYHAQMQKNGKSPDSCVAVARVFNKMPWP